MHSPPATPQRAEERKTGTEEGLAFSSGRHTPSKRTEELGQTWGGKPRALTAGKSASYQN